MSLDRRLLTISGSRPQARSPTCGAPPREPRGSATRAKPRPSFALCSFPCIDEVRALPSPAVMLSATVPAVSGRGRRQTRWPLPPPALPNRSCSCRERNQARAPRGDQAPTGHVSSVLHAISQGGPSPSARNCGAGAPFAPTRWSLPRPFATMQAPRNPALCLGAYPTVVATECPEPPCPERVLPAPGCRRSYGLMRQTTTLPAPPVCPLRARSLQVLARPCWAMALPDIISATLVQVLGPTQARRRRRQLRDHPRPLPRLDCPTALQSGLECPGFDGALVCRSCQ